MTTQVTTKVRLVRCPKCQQVLAELPDISLYKCGGCGTILQAKNRKPETNSTGLISSQETVSVAKSRQQDNNGLGEKEANDFASPSKDESVSVCLSVSPEVTSPVDEDTNIQVKESLKDNNQPSGQIYSKRDHIKCHDDNGERNFSNELVSSGEFTLEAEVHNTPEGDIGVDDEVKSLSEHEEHEIVSRENDNVSRSPEQRLEVDGEADGRPIFRSSSTEKDMNESASDSTAASQKSPLNESLVSFYLTSPDDENPDHFAREVTRKLGRVSSIDTLGSSPLADLSSELNFKRGSVTNNYPTSSRNYYAYDGSESSYDGTYDQNFEHIPHPSRKNKNKQSYRRNLLPPRPGFNSSENQNRIDLLRTVCELKDQLNRMHFPKVTTNNGEFTNFRYNHSAPEREMHYAGLNHPVRYNPRHRLAFSGDAADARYRHQVSCSCLHYSAHLPSNCMHCKNGFQTDDCCSNISTSFSPQRYTSSEHSSRDNEMKRLRLKEKYHRTAKRYLRPLAGGAPILACYHCSELLQVPADFLLFKKRYHKLMCNACKKVLEFSLLKGTRIVPYLPDASAPPPSDAEGFDDAIRRRNLDRSSHSSSCQHVKQTSYSDDYGRSFNNVEGNSYNRKMSSKGSYETMEDRKMKSISREPQNKKSTSSEIEELPPSSSNSPLHRLMGYSSPSQVLRKN